MHGLFRKTAKEEEQVWGPKIVVWGIWSLRFLHDIYGRVYSQHWTLRERLSRGLGAGGGKGRR